MLSAGAGSRACVPNCSGTACDLNRNQGRRQMHPENLAPPGRTAGIQVQKEEGKRDDKKGGGRDLEAKWESVTCKKQNKTDQKNPQNFRL